jgi:DNA invertase Pin-like site-specific DNA recombinase
VLSFRLRGRKATFAKQSVNPCWSDNATASSRRSVKAGARVGLPTARRQAAQIIRLTEAGVRPSEFAVKLGIGRVSVYRVLGSRSRVDRVAA